MYPIVWRLNPLRLWSSGDKTFTISRNVWFLGLTSLFTDISSEMVVSILPVYLITFLRLTPERIELRRWTESTEDVSLHVVDRAAEKPLP